jgi:secondary thiamine-phosphate synthase enzyme
MILGVTLPAVSFEIEAPEAVARCFVPAARLDNMPKMRIYHDQFEVRTRGKGLYEITQEVQSKINKAGLRNGIVTMFVQHTSCSIVIMENADPSARRDLEEFFERLVPEDADYFTHDSEGSDDMPSHIRMVLTRTSETLPIVDGKMQLGTWQGIFLFEHRRVPYWRKLFLTVVGE